MCDLSVLLWYTQKAEDVQLCRCHISRQDRCLSKSITPTCERDGSGGQRHSLSSCLGMDDRKGARVEAQWLEKDSFLRKDMFARADILISGGERGRW